MNADVNTSILINVYSSKEAFPSSVQIPRHVHRQKANRLLESQYTLKVKNHSIFLPFKTKYDTTAFVGQLKAAPVKHGLKKVSELFDHLCRRFASNFFIQTHLNVACKFYLTNRSSFYCSVSQQFFL